MKKLFNNELGSCILESFTTGKGSNGGTLGWFKITGKNIKVKRSGRRIFQKNDYGQETYVTKENFVTICQPKIELNANYKAPEESWLNTLVHEMCHYYTYMNGYAPKQGHGLEFRQIGSVVASRSNGMITIQRLASAEEMRNYDLDDDIKIKNQARLERKKSNLYALLIVLENGQIRLVTTTSERLIGDIGDIHAEKKDSKYYGYSDDQNLIAMLFSKGYRSSMRTYRFWDITNKEWVNTLPNYKWTRYFGSCNTLTEALGINNITNEKPQSSTTNINNDKAEEYKLGYKIIQDNGGYNLVSQNTNKTTFNKPVEKLWFDNSQNLYFFKNGKFTFMGTPGNWTKCNMEENKERNINEENIYLKKLIRETFEEIINEKMGINNDVIDINPDMNLGLESPFEIK